MKNDFNFLKAMVFFLSSFFITAFLHSVPSKRKTYKRKCHGFFISGGR